MVRHIDGNNLDGGNSGKSILKIDDVRREVRKWAQILGIVTLVEKSSPSIKIGKITEKKFMFGVVDPLDPHGNYIEHDGYG